MLFLAALFAALGNAQSGKIGRGKYLTEEVAKCQDCHTQRLASGEFDKKAWLKGAALKAGVSAPDITAGGELWKRRGEKGMLRFLENGGHPEGGTATPPMPPYKLRPDDAEAIVAYLKSLH